jgi:hypothetical protein
MNVSAVIVTRGNVDLSPIIDRLADAPSIIEIVVWNNSKEQDLSVYGRYKAIERCGCDLIFVQDDDCLVDADLIIRCWMSGNSFDSTEMIRKARQISPDLACNYKEAAWIADANQGYIRDYVYIVANMPASRWPDYPDSCLVGWGAVFHRNLPDKAFRRFRDWQLATSGVALKTESDWFQRTCDVVFTTLTPHVKVDAGFQHLPWAEGPGRMFTDDYQRHRSERERMLQIARQVRDRD